jgi:two-component system sensor histidine kinase TctE
VKHQYSIQRRLLLIGAALLVLVSLFIFWAVRWYAHNAAEEAFDRVLGAAALSIADTVSIEEGEATVDLPHSAFAILGTSRLNRIFYRVVAPDGTLITGAPILGLEVPHGTGPGLRFFSSEYRGAPVRIAAVARYHTDAGGGGWLDVLVAETREARDQLGLQLTINAALPSLALALLAFVLIWLAIRRAFAPLRTVEKDLRHRAVSDLSPIAGPVPREVSALVSALNEFMDRLNSVLVGLKNVTADAAHQLRTPLTAMRALSELALESAPEGRHREIMRRIHSNSVSATVLANQILSDATTLHSLETRMREPLDMRQVINDAIQRLQSEGNHPGLPQALKLSLPDEPVIVEGEPVSLREMIRNLVENAQTHAPGEIVVALNERDDEMLLTVSDRGPGIAPELRERVFERFERAGSNRPGTGLGLPIARNVARAMGGTIAIGDREGGGLEVSVRLPRWKLGGGATP